MTVRTTNDGVTTGQTGRFTTGHADAVMVPSTGNVAGKTPVVFMTGGGTTAAEALSKAGVDPHMDQICDVGKFSVVQPSVEWMLGNDMSMSLIHDAIAWGVAHLGFNANPPIVWGVSNGWICALLYALQYPTSAVIGMLTVTAGQRAYDDDPLGIRARIESAWGVTYPAPPPARFSPYDDVASYPEGFGDKLQAWMAGDDLLYAQNQTSFLAQIRAAEIHDVGSYNHVGSFDDPTAAIGQIPAGDPLRWVQKFA